MKSRMTSTAGARTIAISGIVIAAANFATPLHALVLPGLPGAAIPTKVNIVQDAGQLKQALSAARPGTRIELKPGNYGVLTFRNFKNAGAPVVITAVPLAALGSMAAIGAKPVFSSIDLTGSSGVTISNVAVVGSVTPLVNMTLGSNLILTGSAISGAARNSDPWDDSAHGVWIRSASRITLSGNQFQDLRLAGYVQRSSQVGIAENDVTFVREGFNVTAVDGIWFHRNSFSQFSPKYHEGEHPDAIQFWTTGEAVGNANVLISENVMSFGGKRAVQGIFMRSEQADAYGKPHIVNSKVRVVGNVYYGSSRHGISLSSVVDGDIRNNSIFASPWADRNNAAGFSDAGRSSGGLQPAIMVRLPVRVNVHHNAAPLLIATEAGSSFFDNLDLWDSLQKKGVAIGDLLQKTPVTDLPPLADFAIRNPSIARTRGIAALLLPIVGPRVAAGQMELRANWYQATLGAIANLQP